MLDAPIVRGGRTIGVICHEHLGQMRSWYETELAFVESLSDFLTLALYANEGAQLAERNRMLASIVEAMPDPVVTVDVDGNPVYLNQAAYKTLEPGAQTGLSEFQVQHISQSYSAEALQFRADVIVPAALKNGYWRGEVRLTTRQGTEIPAWQTMVAHRDRAGDLKLLTSILRDLREQKATETRLRESEAKLQALNLQLEARVAELEVPLRSIDRDSRRVLEEFGAALPDAARVLIQQLSGSAARMRTLIDPGTTP
jgi:PAS domain S-box-containing protein